MDRWLLFLLPGLAAAAALAVAARRCRRTTLREPCLWALFAGASVTTMGLIADHHPSARWVQALSYAAAAVTVCPTMAVLGAKRPQHRAWQWVVVALLATLLLPSAQWALLPGGDRLTLFTAYRLMLIAVVGLGLLNYLPTRNAVASCIAVTGQSVILWPWLADVAATPNRVPIGLSCFVVAIAAAARNRGAGCRGNSPAGSDCNLAWRQFRDLFGAFWAIRVMHRVNEVAASQTPPVRLGWYGFATPGDSGDATVEPPAAVERTLRALLNRFL